MFYNRGAIRIVSFIRTNATILAVAALPVAILSVGEAYFSNSLLIFVLTCIAAGFCLMGLSYAMRNQYLLCMALASVGLVLAAIPLVDRILTGPGVVQDQVQSNAGKPVYSYAKYKEGGGSFRAWWQLYFDAWMKTHWTIFQKDPTGILKYVPKPNTCANFFDGKICINNLGLIGPDAARKKGDAYRIIAVGESTTMGVPLTADHVPWPQLLHQIIRERLVCNKSIEVLNAGIAGFHISDNNMRIETDLINLQPDIILSYHGYNGFHFLFEDLPEPTAALPKGISGRPLALLRGIEYAWRMRAWFASSGGHSSLSDEGLKSTKLYAHLSRFVELSEEGGVDLALLTYNLAIAEDAPADVVVFYKRVFLRGERNVIYNSAQTRILKDLAMASNAIFVDTSEGLNGGWDRNLYTDLVHFTKAGEEVMARNVFNGIAPFLMVNPELQCRTL